MKTIVFFGPSIAESEVRRLAAVTHAPPIKRGDLAAVEDHDVYVILDGEFGQNMSVSPKEILSLLERGKTVIGASSMGALRASERTLSPRLLATDADDPTPLLARMTAANSWT